LNVALNCISCSFPQKIKTFFILKQIKWNDTTSFHHMPFCHSLFAIWASSPYDDSPYVSQFAIQWARVRACRTPAGTYNNDYNFIAKLTCACARKPNPAGLRRWIGTWRTGSYGESAYGKLAMAKRHMAKWRIPKWNSKKYENCFQVAKTKIIFHHQIIQSPLSFWCKNKSDSRKVHIHRSCPIQP